MAIIIVPSNTSAILNNRDLTIVFIFFNQITYFYFQTSST